MIPIRTCWPIVLLATVACRTRHDDPDSPPTAVAATGGFDGPEAVKYDPVQDVWFVSNFGGEGDGLNNDGFISRLRSDGTMDSLRFIAGGSGGVTLHMPRGMAIRGDTLWVADVDAVRGFHRVTGAPLAAVSFVRHQPGFLNDVTAGPDGALYVTDTRDSLVYRVSGGEADTALVASSIGGPNGITWDRARNRFVIVPFFAGSDIFSWRPGGPAERLASGPGGGYDGVEITGGDTLRVASQRDSSLYTFSGDSVVNRLRLRGRPADIGFNPAGRLVAVPFVARDTVEFFNVP